MEQAERRKVAAEIAGDLSELKEKADTANLPLVAYLIDMALTEAKTIASRACLNRDSLI